MSHGWSNQWQHFLIGYSGVALGLVVAFLARPSPWVPALLALLPGFIVWWVMEYIVQWPIGPESDHRLDTAFYTLGRWSAAVTCGVVSSYLR